jgi:ferric-dicitrate binding protein FerR (iron transport regulator)
MPSAAPVNAGIVGIATTGHGATLRQAELQAGATVFNGDLVAVKKGGRALVSLGGGSQVRFSEESAARLARTGNKVEVEFRQGRIGVRTSAASPVEILLADAVIRAGGNGTAVAVVARLSSSRVVVAAEEGSVTLTTARNKKSVELRKGESVEVTLADPSPQTRGQAGSSSISGGKVALIGGILVVGITLLMLANRNDGLTDQEKVDLVSPFRPN